MIVMNLMWDLISDILVTMSGFLFFKEKIGPFKKVGVIFSILAMFLLSIGETEV
jgi:multidrug transporter EmrE-like cation transporter